MQTPNWQRWIALANAVASLVFLLQVGTAGALTFNYANSNAFGGRAFRLHSGKSPSMGLM